MTVWTSTRSTSIPKAHLASAWSAVDLFLLAPIIAATALFLPFNQDFGFDAAGWLDTFVYVGYFWHYPEHLSLFDDYYKISRLPWILPGYAAHTVFGALIGSYVLQWTTLCGGGVALYLLLRDALRHRMIAAVVGVAWVCSTGAHGVGGWNYHMLAAANYYLLACWLVVRAARAHPFAWTPALAGATFAATVHTNLFFIVFVPLLAGIYAAALEWNGVIPWKRLRHDIGLMAAGAAALTAALMVINKATGGDWMFFLPQIRYTRELSQSGADPWWMPARQWIGGATYLTIPLLVTIAATLALARLSPGPVRRLSLAFVLQACGALLISSVYQFGEAHSVLHPEYMAFGVYCAAFPAMAVVFLPRRTGETAMSWQGVVGCMIIPATLVLGGVALLQDDFARIVIPGLSNSPLAVTLLLGGALLIVAAVMPARVRIVALALWFAVVNGTLASTPRAYGIGSPGIRRTMLMLFRETDRFTAKIDPSLLGIKDRFNSEIVASPAGPLNMADVFNSYVATRGWSGNILALDTPNLPLAAIDPVHVLKATCVGLLSSPGRQQETSAAFREAARVAGIPASEIGHARFDGGGLSYGLTVYRVAATPTASPGLPCAPVS